MAILGDNTAGSEVDPGSADRAWLNRFTATEGGTINSAGAYFASSSTSGASCKVVMYTAAGANTPGTLVAASSGSSVPSGGGLVTFTMSGSFSAADYFIGIVSSDFQADLQIDTSLSGMQSVLANGTLSYASPPASWPGTDSSSSAERVNVYIDYTAGGGMTPRLSLLGVG